MGSETYQRFIAPLLDIIIVYYLLYRALILIKGTRAVSMLFGLILIILMFVFSKPSFLDLTTFNWLLESFIGSLFLIVIVVFQADIRRALAAFGRTDLLSSLKSGEGAQVIDELVKASSSLARQRIGALIVVERDADLSPYLQEAVRLDARISKELIYSLFVPERQNPLHDGAIVIQRSRIAAAGVFLPMTVNPKIDRNLGTRHRAALGLSEEIDALVIVVSEERGSISLAREGKLELDLRTSSLRQRLTNLLLKRSAGLFRREKGLIKLSSRGDAGREDS